jgi:hypothetical protein
LELWDSVEKKELGDYYIFRLTQQRSRSPRNGLGFIKHPFERCCVDSAPREAVWTALRAMLENEVPISRSPRVAV